MDGIGRLRIVCVSERRRSSAALAVRSRLERVARSELGRALDGQVDADTPIHLGRLHVRLDLDPDDYDDRTLAILWAGQIREAILAAGDLSASLAADGRTAAAGGSSASDELRRAPSTPAFDEPLPRLVLRAIRGDRAAATAVARAILADPAAAARELRDSLSAPERRALINVLEGRGAGERRRSRLISPGPSLATRLRPVRRSEPRMAVRIAPRSWTATLATAARRWLAGQTRGAATGTVPQGTQVPMRPTPARRGLAAQGDLRLVSQVAGLALLWPWLTAQLEAAADRLTGLDPVGARRLALASFVPGTPSAVDDPVVRLLAGDDLTTDPSLIVVTEGELLLAADGTTDVLEAFAAALPGFAGSTQEFVRREFLVRPGVVDPAVDPVMVRLAPLPLDPALSLVRYPIAAFRLPWTPSIALRMEHA